MSRATSVTYLTQAIADALSRREELFAKLQAEQTDCYRLFHGTTEGAPGLTVDRYGPQLMIQSFHETLRADGQAIVTEAARKHFEPLEVVYRDRSAPNSRYARDPNAPPPVKHVAHELGVKYRVQSEAASQDPLLFLDLRAGRRFVLANSQGKSVLNLFAYTCGLGLCAALGGASEVWNVDFAASSLDIGRENAALNGLAPKAMKFIQGDFFTVARQLAGLPVTLRRSQKQRKFSKVAPRSFDLVLLDPPHWAKSPFGTVDLVRDYQSVLKPALLATAEGGRLLCTNNVAAVELEEWVKVLRRCAGKSGRTVRSVELIRPESDFPSPDGRHPLKTAVLQL